MLNRPGDRAEAPEGNASTTSSRRHAAPDFGRGLRGPGFCDTEELLERREVGLALNAHLPTGFAADPIRHVRFRALTLGMGFAWVAEDIIRE